MFSQMIYSCVNEDGKSAQPVLVLSEPSLINTIVEVYSIDETATGEYCSSLINY